MVRRAPQQLDELVHKARQRSICEWRELTRMRVGSADLIAARCRWHPVGIHQRMEIQSYAYLLKDLLRADSSDSCIDEVPVELLYKNEVYDIIGAAIEVYNVLGPGFLEPVYQEAFEIELRERGTPFVFHPELHIYFKEHLLKKTYVPDFLAHKKVILEIKALERLTSNDEAQLLNYLKATRLELGVLINFGAADKPEWKRMVKTEQFLAKESTA